MILRPRPWHQYTEEPIVEIKAVLGDVRVQIRGTSILQTSGKTK